MSSLSSMKFYFFIMSEGNRPQEKKPTYQLPAYISGNGLYSKTDSRKSYRPQEKRSVCDYGRFRATEYRKSLFNFFCYTLLCCPSVAKKICACIKIRKSLFNFYLLSLLYAPSANKKFLEVSTERS